ncbi:MAG: TRAP transporter small permease [Desulfobacterales bacterium]
MKTLKFFDKLIRFFEKYVTITLMLFICSLLLLQTFTRYILNNPLSWPEELLRFCFVSMIYLAISYAASLDAHIRIEMHIRLLSIKWQTVIFSIGDLMWIVFNIVIIVEGIKVVRTLFINPYISPVMQVSMAYVYCIIPFAFTLVTIRIIQHFYLRIMRLRKP